MQMARTFVVYLAASYGGSYFKASSQIDNSHENFQETDARSQKVPSPAARKQLRFSLGVPVEWRRKISPHLAQTTRDGKNIKTKNNNGKSLQSEPQKQSNQESSPVADGGKLRAII